MAERNFDDEFDYSGMEGHTFVLGGRKFHTQAVAPPGAFLQHSRGLEAAIDFLRRVIVEEDLTSFEEIIDANNPDVVISAHQVDEVAAWVIAATTGRPTLGPASSGSGPETTSTSSTGNSPSQAKNGDD